MDQKKLIIFSNNLDDQKIIGRSLQIYLGDLIVVESMSSKDAPPSYDPPIVLSTESTIGIAKKTFLKSKILFVSRLISSNNLEEIIMIPKATKVLVANEPASAAMETIEGLKEFGIDHLHLIPYWPGSDENISSIDTVIYPGFRGYCPHGLKKYINIGYRDIKFSILLQIIKEYNLDPQIIDAIQKKYSQRNIAAAYKINTYLQDAKTSRNNFQKILSISKNIFICTDTNDNIISFNTSAEAFFCMKGRALLHTNFISTFKNHPQLIQLYNQNQALEDQIVTLNGSSAIISISKLKYDREENTLINIMPADAIQRTDAKIRSQLKESGYKAKYTFEHILGNSDVIQKTKTLARQYAKTDSTIYITGESGTGKELFAQAIHNASSRSQFPFVSINCAALPESLAESELFGYDEGSFTGAVKGGKAGKFETAHRGTIFLDEIGDTSLSIQTKLLRVIEEQEVVRIGSNKVTPIDVRILCATNKDLLTMIKNGTFRKDLYYRIRVLPLHIPSLSERKEDIRVIADSMFLQYELNDGMLLDYLIDKMYSYSWPGNIRELRSAVQLLSALREITDDDSIDETYWSDIFQQYYSDQNEEEAFISKPEDELYLILKVIAAKSQANKPFGRGTLLKDAQLLHLRLTEYRLKQHIIELSDRSLIKIGSTKQGMRISDQGKEYLRLNEATHHGGRP